MIDPEQALCDARGDEEPHILKPRLTDVRWGGHPHAEWRCYFCGRTRDDIREQERERGH